jgi:hypothetical protein
MTADLADLAVAWGTVADLARWVLAHELSGPVNAPQQPCRDILLFG